MDINYPAASSCISSALQAMEQAYYKNRDASVGSLIAQAMSALHELEQHGAQYEGAGRHQETDPYEMNEFNSTI